jgi:hypothetical protein
MSLKKVLIMNVKNYKLNKQFRKERRQANSLFRVEFYLQKTKKIYDKQCRKKFNYL